VKLRCRARPRLRYGPPMLRRTSIALVTLVLAACAAPHAAPPPNAPAPCASAPAASASPSSSSSEAAALDKLFKDSWEAGLADDPLGASMLGDRRWNDRWPEYTLAAVERRRLRREEELRRLHAIPRAAL